MNINRNGQLREGCTCTAGNCRFSVIRARLCLVFLVLLNAACTHMSAVDKPLAQWTPELEQRADKQLEGDRKPELAVLVAFSGGGTRASAFAYGVLKELADTEVITAKGTRPLLHEVDVISSVSGGSFTAAYTTGCTASGSLLTSSSVFCVRMWKAFCCGKCSIRSTGLNC